MEEDALTHLAEHGEEFGSELLSRQTIEEEIDGMVEVGELVADGFCYLIGIVGILCPMGFSNEDNDAWNDTKEEDKGDAETHHRRLFEGLRFVVRRCLRLPHLNEARPCQGPDHDAVADEEDDEWDDADQSQSHPRTIESLEYGRRRIGVSTVGHQMTTGIVLSSSCPEDVKVLDH